MRVFLSALLLILSFQSWTKAEIKIDNIFGVKLYSDVSDYSEVENGREHVSFPNVITFIDMHINIDRDPEFSQYYLRTNKDYKVVNISAGKVISSSKDEFNNQCSSKKKKFISNLAASLEMDEQLFKKRFRKEKKGFSKDFKGLWEDSSYTFVDENKKARLIIYCIYVLNLNNNIFREKLSVTLMTEDYYRSNVMNRFDLTEPFNKVFIKNYIFNN